jgi:hypothetical protein
VKRTPAAGDHVAEMLTSALPLPPPRAAQERVAVGHVHYGSELLDLEVTAGSATAPAASSARDAGRGGDAVSL